MLDWYWMRTHGHLGFGTSELSEFAYGRNKVSPGSEQIEHIVAKQHVRNSGSVKQIQDRLERFCGCVEKHISKTRNCR